MAIDLHAHTTASDGSLPPTALVRYAAKQGVSALAVTDHDTVGGLPEALQEGARLGVEIIPGMENSTSADGCDVHLICLFLDFRHPALLEQLARLSKSRQDRNVKMLARLADAGMDVSPEDLARFPGPTVVKGHIAQLLIDRGYARGIGEAITRYLSKGTAGYVRREVPAPEECIRVCHQAGGLVFVAHVNQIDRRDEDHSIAICRRMLEAGADGLETLYCEYDDNWRARTEALAREYGALRSGGSDFHGTFKPGLELGVGYGDLSVPECFLDAMQRRLGR